MAFLDLLNGFRISGNFPIDERFVKADEDARLSIPSGQVYEGLWVYQEDNDRVYMLTDLSEASNEIGWTEITANNIKSIDESGGNITITFDDDSTTEFMIPGLRDTNPIVDNSDGTYTFHFQGGANPTSFTTQDFEAKDLASGTGTTVGNDLVIEWTRKDGTGLQTIVTDGKGNPGEQGESVFFVYADDVLGNGQSFTQNGNKDFIAFAVSQDRPTLPINSTFIKFVGSDGTNFNPALFTASTTPTATGNIVRILYNGVNLTSFTTTDGMDGADGTQTTLVVDEPTENTPLAENDGDIAIYVGTDQSLIGNNYVATNVTDSTTTWTLRGNTRGPAGTGTSNIDGIKIEGTDLTLDENGTAVGIVVPIAQGTTNNNTLASQGYVDTHSGNSNVDDIKIESGSLVLDEGGTTLGSGVTLNAITTGTVKLTPSGAQTIDGETILQGRTALQQDDGSDIITTGATSGDLHIYDENGNQVAHLDGSSGQLYANPNSSSSSADTSNDSKVMRAGGLEIGATSIGHADHPGSATEDAVISLGYEGTVISQLPLDIIESSDDALDFVRNNTNGRLDLILSDTVQANDQKPVTSAAVQTALSNFDNGAHYEGQYPTSYDAEFLLDQGSTWLEAGEIWLYIGTTLTVDSTGDLNALRPSSNNNLWVQISPDGTGKTYAGSAFPASPSDGDVFYLELHDTSGTNDDTPGWYVYRDAAPASGTINTDYQSVTLADWYISGESIEATGIYPTLGDTLGGDTIEDVSHVEQFEVTAGIWTFDDVAYVYSGFPHDIDTTQDLWDSAPLEPGTTDTLRAGWEVFVALPQGASTFQVPVWDADNNADKWVNELLDMRGLTNGVEATRDLIQDTTQSDTDRFPISKELAVSLFAPIGSTGGGGGGVRISTNGTGTATSVPAGGIAIITATQQYYNVTTLAISVPVQASLADATTYFETTNFTSWVRVGDGTGATVPQLNDEIAARIAGDSNLQTEITNLTDDLTRHDVPSEFYYQFEGLPAAYTNTGGTEAARTVAFSNDIDVVTELYQGEALGFRPYDTKAILVPSGDGTTTQEITVAYGEGGVFAVITENDFATHRLNGVSEIFSATGTHTNAGVVTMGGNYLFFGTHDGSILQVELGHILNNDGTLRASSTLATSQFFDRKITNPTGITLSGLEVVYWGGTNDAVCLFAGGSGRAVRIRQTVDDEFFSVDTLSTEIYTELTFNRLNSGSVHTHDFNINKIKVLKSSQVNATIPTRSTDPNTVVTDSVVAFLGNSTGSDSGGTPVPGIAVAISPEDDGYDGRIYVVAGNDPSDDYKNYNFTTDDERLDAHIFDAEYIQDGSGQNYFVYVGQENNTDAHRNAFIVWGENPFNLNLISRETRAAIGPRLNSVSAGRNFANTANTAWFAGGNGAVWSISPPTTEAANTTGWNDTASWSGANLIQALTDPTDTSSDKINDFLMVGFDWYNATYAVGAGYDGRVYRYLTQSDITFSFSLPGSATEYVATFDNFSSTTGTTALRDYFADSSNYTPGVPANVGFTIINPDVATQPANRSYLNISQTGMQVPPVFEISNTGLLTTTDTTFPSVHSPWIFFTDEATSVTITATETDGTVHSWTVDLSTDSQHQTAESAVEQIVNYIGTDPASRVYATRPVSDFHDAVTTTKPVMIINWQGVHSFDARPTVVIGVDPGIDEEGSLVVDDFLHGALDSIGQEAGLIDPNQYYTKDQIAAKFDYVLEQLGSQEGLGHLIIPFTTPQSGTPLTAIDVDGEIYTIPGSGLSNILSSGFILMGEIAKATSFTESVDVYQDDQNHFGDSNAYYIFTGATSIMVGGVATTVVSDGWYKITATIVANEITEILTIGSLIVNFR